MSVTTAQVDAAVEEVDGGWNDFSYGPEGTLTVDGTDYPVKSLVDDTGGEGHGEHVEIVFSVGDQIFRKQGYYASHYGTDWDGPLDEVRPEQKTVTVYRKV